MVITITFIGLLTYFYLVTRSGAQLECGSSYRRATDVFQNLSFHDNGTHFYDSAVCMWTIYAENLFNIVKAEVTTTDLSDVAMPCSENRNNVTAYDVFTSSDENILTWCMDETPTLTSSGRSLRFILRLTSIRRGGPRFSLRYKQVLPPTICQGNLSSSSLHNVFASYGYPQRLQKNLNCSILISTSSSSNVLKLSVIDADLGSTCIYIYDGLTTSDLLLTKICGKQIPVFRSSGENVLVQFSTGDNTTERGFKMRYQSVSKLYDCPHRVLRALDSRDEIRSPFYPNMYPNNADCTWSINALDVKAKIYIKMVKFELEDTPNCTADYLQMYDGDELDEYWIGKWCGNRAPPNWLSTRSHVLVKFHSNERVTMSGFELEYSRRSNASTPSSGSSNNYGLMSTVVGVVVFCVFCICSCAACRYRYRMRHSGLRRSTFSPTLSLQRFRARAAQPARNAQRSEPARTARPSRTARPAQNPESVQSARPRARQTVYTIDRDASTTATRAQTTTPSQNTTLAQNSIPASALPPPSYDEVISKDALNRTASSPPPYSTVTASSDIDPSNS